jgi:competence protein ComEC
MLAFDPRAIGDVGFLLSALATAGLLFLGDPLLRRMPRLPRFAREGLATTLAATLPTLPLVAAVFGRVSLVSPLANLAAVPMFPPLMLAGAATAASGMVSLDLARPFALVAYGLAFALRVVVERSAALPGASLAVPDGPLAGAAYAAAVGAALRFGPPALRTLLRAARRRAARLRANAIRISPPAVPRPSASAVATAVAIVVAAAAGCVAVSAEPAAPIRVLALDVGQGDAYLVQVPGALALIDGGPDPGRLLAELGATLPPWTRRIDLVVLTHAHVDHAAGLMAVLERYEVGLALEPAGLNAGPVADAWSERIANAHVARRAVGAGARLRLGDASVTVLSPEDDPRVDVPSLVLRVERPGFSALFMGDATDQAQADLLLHSAALVSRVYVPPHHGAATPHAAELVTAVHPSAALISVGAGNRYGHPTPETLAALAGVPTYRTDRDGTVEVSLDGTRLAVRAHANGLPPPRGGSVPHAPPPR